MAAPASGRGEDGQGEIAADAVDEGMKAPATVVPPQTSAPSQKRQIGALQEGIPARVPERDRLADRPPCSQRSQRQEKPAER